LIDQPFRQILPRFSKPLIGFYAALRLSPNHITIGGLVLALGAAAATAQGWPMLAFCLWWVGRLLDGTDGIYARATGQSSDFGGYLDIVCDMAAYGAMILGFALWQPQHGFLWAIILFLYILCITSALALGAIQERRSLGAADNRTLRLASGLAEGGETGIAYSLMLLLPQFIESLAIVWIGVLVTTVLARSWLAAQQDSR
jgi:phosphatidylglycerophosphate synthase